MNNNNFAIFLKTDSVRGQIPNEPGGGLGPTFNGNSCVQCHSEPAAGKAKAPAHLVPRPFGRLWPELLQGLAHFVLPLLRS